VPVDYCAGITGVRSSGDIPLRAGVNGVHDMGGMHGFGRVKREENEPVFHELWESRLYGINASRRVKVPGGRFAIESIGPARYLAASYYERWLDALETLVIRGGLITREELEAGQRRFRENPDAEVPRRDDPEMVAAINEERRRGRSARGGVEVSAAFAAGDEVRVRNLNPRGHTRLPRYARGKRGTIARLYGGQGFQDTHENGAPISGDPQAVYAVRFDAAELWGEAAEIGSSVYIDMWETYLEAA
jgi:nitrile hydratase